MNIVINGEARDVSENSTLGNLIDTLNIAKKLVACTINTIVIKRDQYDTTVLHEDDQIELLSFMGGGCK